ncbi:MAG: PIN domain-containing protein [Cyclobacteriaceae bacterium]
MIQRVFLDTNVIIDLIINREPFVREAEEIFTLSDSYNYEVIVSALTIANLAYAIDRLNKKPHESIARLFPLVKIIDLSSSIIEETIVSIFKDFEDGLQHSSALAAKADIIVTRNEKDFKHSLIPVMSPQDFLDLFKPESNN